MCDNFHVTFVKFVIVLPIVITALWISIEKIRATFLFNYAGSNVREQLIKEEAGDTDIDTRTHPCIRRLHKEI